MLKIDGKEQVEGAVILSTAPISNLDSQTKK